MDDIKCDSDLVEKLKGATLVANGLKRVAVGRNGIRSHLFSLSCGYFTISLR